MPPDATQKNHPSRLLVAEGEAVVMGVLGAVSVVERTVLLKLRVRVLRLDCLALSVLLLKLRVKPLLWVYLVQCLSVA